MVEEMRNKLLKPPVETASIVFDMNGFSIQKNMDYTQLKFMISIFEAKYPETLGVALVVDAPFIFQACWKLIRPWLDPKTASKVYFVSLSDLTQWIDEDQLLVDLGGKNPMPV